ncbi:ketoacyl-synthetase C-terminal extension domain-containing protein [Rhizobium mongolense]|nr:ketoacyl-synthetase C-terminal extension domain-containing protein [Rhizobium mongolense]
MANYTRPNPRIDLDNSPFYIPAEMMDWPKQEGPRYAGVSSFGVGGTNVHVILEEPPSRKRDMAGDVRGPHILPLSARNPAALSAMRSNLKNHLVKHPGASLAEIAHTLQAGRRQFSHRIAIAATNADEAQERLVADRYQSSGRATRHHRSHSCFRGKARNMLAWVQPFIATSRSLRSGSIAGRRW